jgi:hypothetical protein
MFKKNYMNEMPDDVARLVFKYVYDGLLYQIEERDFLNYDNEMYIQALKFHMKELCERTSFLHRNSTNYNEFPFNQIAYWGKSTGDFAKYKFDKDNREIYSYIDKETGNLKLEDRIDMHLITKRKVFAEPHKVKYVRLRSKYIENIWRNQKLVLMWFNDRMNEWTLETEDKLGIGTFTYTMRIDDGDLLIELIEDTGTTWDMFECLAQFLIIFSQMFDKFEEIVQEMYDELVGFESDGEKDITLMDEKVSIEIVKKYIGGLDDMCCSEYKFLNNCDICIEKNSDEETIVLTNKFNGHTDGHGDFYNDDDDSDDE